MGDNSLEGCPIMLEKNMNKKIVNNLSCVPKTGIKCAENLQVITRYGKRTGLDKPESKSIKYIHKDDYPNCEKQKELFKDAKKVFEEISANEEKSKSHTIKEILNLLSNEKVA